MIARKLLGLLIAVFGIALGAFFTGITAILITGYWTEPHRAGMESGLRQIIATTIGALIGYGIYRFGRFIAR